MSLQGPRGPHLWSAQPKFTLFVPHDSRGAPARLPPIRDVHRLCSNSCFAEAAWYPMSAVPHARDSRGAQARLPRFVMCVRFAAHVVLGIIPPDLKVIRGYHPSLVQHLISCATSHLLCNIPSLPFVLVSLCRRMARSRCSPGRPQNHTQGTRSKQEGNKGTCPSCPSHLMPQRSGPPSVGSGLSPLPGGIPAQWQPWTGTPAPTPLR